MAKITINKEKCKGCCLCVAECPRGAISMSDKSNNQGVTYATVVDSDKCTGCALCCQMCPDVAIEIKS